MCKEIIDIYCEKSHDRPEWTVLKFQLLPLSFKGVMWLELG